MKGEQAKIGARLRLLREERKLSLRKLAAIAGMKHSYISRIERNEIGSPSIETVGKLADALNVPLEMVLEGDIPTSWDDAIRNLMVLSGMDKGDVEDVLKAFFALQPHNQEALRHVAQALLKSQAPKDGEDSGNNERGGNGSEPDTNEGRQMTPSGGVLTAGVEGGAVAIFERGGTMEYRLEHCY